MKTRIDFDNVLRGVLGSTNVWFQPPPSKSVGSESIIYELSNINFDHADNTKYKGMKKYQVTFITKNPDSPIVDSLLALQYCSFDRKFSANNLNHFTFTIYY